MCDTSFNSFKNCINYNASKNKFIFANTCATSAACVQNSGGSECQTCNNIQNSIQTQLNIGGLNNIVSERQRRLQTLCSKRDNYLKSSETTIDKLDTKIEKNTSKIHSDMSKLGTKNELLTELRKRVIHLDADLQTSTAKKDADYADDKQVVTAFGIYLFDIPSWIYLWSLAFLALLLFIAIIYFSYHIIKDFLT